MTPHSVAQYFWFVSLQAEKLVLKEGGTKEQLATVWERLGDQAAELQNWYKVLCPSLVL